jgi:hypothetical protein
MDRKPSAQRSRQLRAEAIGFTYPGWKEDVKQNVYLAQMKKEQKIHDGYRSHSQLRALDAVTITYSGWLENFKEVEQTQIANPADFNCQLSPQMKKKEQMLHDGGRSHSQLRALDAVTFAYPYWSAEFKEAEQHHIKKRSACWSDSQLSRMKRK